jgi:short-subunit dehydrogenase
MKRSLPGRRLLITGASRGIGRALAELAAQRGAHVGLVARSQAQLQQIADALQARGANVLALVADVTSPEDRRRLVDQFVDHFGGLDVLVNNAGVGSFGHFIDSSEEVLREIMEVNFFAAAELMRTCLPALIQGNQPAVINISSMCGRRGLPAWSEYCASKFAICGLTECLRAELIRFGVDMLLILPGLTRTELGSHLLRNTGRMNIDFTGGMPPEELARRILQALERNRPETVVGREAHWLLGLNRFVPRFLDRLIARKIRALYAEEMKNGSHKTVETSAGAKN